MVKSSSEEVQNWKNLILEQRESGLSIAVWCRQKTIAVYRFYYWRDKLFPNSLPARSDFAELAEKPKTPSLIFIEYRAKVLRVLAP